MNEPSGRVYADSTALIGPARIDRLDLLAMLPTPVLVTAHVWHEVAHDAAKPGVGALRQARSSGLLAVVQTGDPDAFPTLDPGESTVLSAAVAARAMALLDERKARALIVSDPDLAMAIPRVTGVLGLILLAKRRGELPAVQPVLDDLIRQRFWISPSLYEELLREASEL